MTSGFLGLGTFFGSSVVLFINGKCRPNLGRPREIGRCVTGIKLHRSVKIRMEANASGSSQKYQPRPKLPFDAVEWVD